MTNKEIRRRAWDLCRQHFWKLLTASLFISLLTSLVSAPLSMAAAQNPAVLGSAMTFLSLLLLILLVVILEAGLLQYIANLWHDEPAGIPTLFTHAGKVFRLLGIMLLTMLMMYAAALPGVFVMELIGSFVPFLSVVLAFVLMVFMFYVMLRISPAMTAFVLNPGLTAMQCIKTSWRATKGSVRRIFGHMFMLMLPMFAASLLISLLTPAAAGYASPIANAIVSIVTLLITTLFTIYMQFGQYGLNELLLTAAQPADPFDASPILPGETEEETDEYEDIPESEQDSTDDETNSN